MENNNEKKIKLTWNKKVISISFLVLALFMLLAVSYAYFTAKVEGNEDAESITVEAAKMSLKLTGPTEVSLPNALPGTEVKSEFTVTNTGTVQTTYNLDMIDVTNTFVDNGDLVYSITSTNDGGHVENVVAPTTSQTLIRNILIQPGDDNAQIYTLTVRFRETGVDQNSNQGKKFTGRIQINNLEDKSLAAAILRANPIQDSTKIDFSKGSPYYEYNSDKFVKNGDGLFTAPDNDGASYYFRGTVENNIVSFADRNWKILRINGDGSIRLIYNDKNGPKESAFNTEDNQMDYVGYTSNNEHHCTNAEPCYSDYRDKAFVEYYINSNTGAEQEIINNTDSDIKTALENWYSSTLSTYDEQISLETFCNDTSLISSSDFGPKERVAQTYKPILTCPDPTDFDSSNTHNYGGVYKLKIGLITADEIKMSGIYNNPSIAPFNFLDNIIDDGWTMSPAWLYSGMTILYLYESELRSYPSNYSYKVIPVINLKPDVKFTGTGTEDDPYTITNN